MVPASSSSGADQQLFLGDDEHFEYRVWGVHEAAEAAILDLAESDPSQEHLADCYLLGKDTDWNVKVRDYKLKLKQRSGATAGFERWSTQWCTGEADTPPRFNTVFRQLDLERAQQGHPYDLVAAVEVLDETTQPVFVTKRRRIFQIGDVDAEIADLRITDDQPRLHSISVIGEEIEVLVDLLEELGLNEHPNVAMHEMIASTVTGSG